MHFPVVDEIDFLPAGFHDRQRRRRARSWRWVFAAAFVALAALGLAGNRLQHARLEAARDRLAPQAGAVADLDRQSAEVRSRIDSLGLKADLRGLLRLRPSTTRLLIAVTTPLPPHTTLTELHVADARSFAPAAPVTPAADQPVPPPARLDLDRLIANSDRRLVLTLRGIAPDDAAVSDYLAGLGRSGLFEEVRLLFTDHHDYGGHDLRAFSAELRVRAAESPSSSSPPTPTTVAAGSDGGAL